MKNITQHFYKILVVVLCVGISYALAQAQSANWSAPTATPPAGNVSAPIHVGSQNQVKAGGLTVSVATSTDSNVTAQISVRGSSNTGLRIFDRANNVDSWQFYSNRDVASGNSWLRIYNHQNNKDQVIINNNGIESANNIVANGAVDVKGTTAGVKLFNRTEPAKLWQWYSYSLGSPLKNRAALYNHDTSSDQLWVNSDGLGVTGTVWSGGVVTGTLQVTNGSPAVGKVLGATDVHGTVGWVEPKVTYQNETFNYLPANVGEDIYVATGAIFASYNENHSGPTLHGGQVDTCDGEFRNKYECPVNVARTCMDYGNAYSCRDDACTYGFNVTCKKALIPIKTE